MRQAGDDADDGRPQGPHYFTSFRGIMPGGAGSDSVSTLPLRGGTSWNMKSHFHRSDGLEACSQWRAAIGRAKARAPMPSSAATWPKRPAMSARTCADAE